MVFFRKKIYSSWEALASPSFLKAYVTLGLALISCGCSSQVPHTRVAWKNRNQVSHSSGDLTFRVSAGLCSLEGSFLAASAGSWQSLLLPGLRGTTPTSASAIAGRSPCVSLSSSCKDTGHIEWEAHLTPWGATSSYLGYSCKDPVSK